MKTVTTQVATEIMSKTVDPVEARFGFTMPALIALVTQAFFRRHGIAGERVPDVLSRLMYRAHRIGADNPLAAFAGKPETLAAYFDLKRNLPVATPLRRKDCSPICDGAAAIILTDRPQPVRVAGLGAATDTSSLLDRVELDSLGATRRAAAFAFYQAGIANPATLEGLCVESHDAFNSLLPVNLVDLGLCGAEQALEALIGSARGADPAEDPYTHPWSGPRGSCPVNLSGGLKSRGHPVGGTGLFQLAELYLQLMGRFPNRRAQAADAQLGLSHSIGGPGNNVYVTLLERADSARRRARDLPPPRRRAERRPMPLPALALHGRAALIEAATTIYVTASGDGPIHVALLSVDGRRVFARFAEPVDPRDDLSQTLPGRSARFLVTESGDHEFALLPEAFAQSA
jgi:acetyl-CoA C-acetyltransferase